MARRDALLRITTSLVARRIELRRRLGDELKDLGLRSDVTSGDAADVAFGQAGEEIASQLAMVEARELSQVEHALAQIKQGRYGICAGCSSKILVARLNALPYSTLCIACQREVEKDSTWLDSRARPVWEQVRDGVADNREVTLADLEADIVK